MQLTASSPASPAWAVTLYTWHTAAIFLASLTALAVCDKIARPSAPLHNQVSVSEIKMKKKNCLTQMGSGSQLVACTVVSLPGGVARPPGSQQVRLSSAQPSVVDVEPWDKLQLANFNKQ